MMTLPGMIGLSVCLLCLLLVGGVYSRRRVAFVIHVQEGRVRPGRGSPSPEFLKDAQNICQLFGLRTGKIKGIRRGKAIVIRCVGGDFRKYEQNFQNAWNHPI